jgi:hypothetical protein
MPAQTDKLFDARDESIAQAMLALLSKRQPGRSICPSDVARHLAKDQAAWRALMPAVRAVAAQLAREGKLVATQKDAVVDVQQARGPIRLRLAQQGKDGT